MPRHYVIERVAENSRAVYYRCSAGKAGGEMVTVRVGRENIFACMTCRTITCDHCRAARAFAETEPAAASKAA